MRMSVISLTHNEQIHILLHYVMYVACLVTLRIVINNTKAIWLSVNVC